MSLLIGLFGGLLFSILPWALGQWVFEKASEVSLSMKAATGWLLIYLLTLAMALGFGLNRGTLIAMSLILACFVLKIIVKGVCSLYFNLKLIVKDASRLEKIALLVSCAILSIRFIQSTTPTLNFDSLNQHLPLLAARLAQGDLAPLYELPVDRRIPFSGVIVKLPLYCFGEDGRAISIANFGIYLLLIFQIWETLKKSGSKTAAVIAIICIISWIDIATYFRHVSDEPIFCLLMMAAMSTILIRPKSVGVYWVLACVLGLCFSIKLTTLFFVPIVVVMIAIKCAKEHALGNSLCLVLLALSFGGISYIKQYNDYHMIYPIKRGTDLMDFGPDIPKVYDFEEMRQNRLALGLLDHVDNQKIGNGVFSKWTANFNKLIYLPLGPYIYWSLLALPFMYLKRRETKGALSLQLRMCFGVVLLSLNLAMCVWSFSPQAMTRYLLPIWGVWAMGLGLFFSVFLESYQIKNWMYGCLLLLLCFCIGIEGRATYVILKRSPWQSIDDYWLKYSSDGPLIKLWQEKTGGQMPTYYVGNASFLMRNSQHRYAQVGNEVGWRDPDKFIEYLDSGRFKFLVYSQSAASLDPMYALLVNRAVEHGVITLTEDSSHGQIFSINPVRE